MAGRSPDDRDPGGYASPPCQAHEIDPAWFEPLGVDPMQPRDVARWRRAERARLLASRRDLGAAALRAVSEALVRQACTLLGGQVGVVSAYWPIKGEPDLRPLMRELDAAGVRVALPVVETKAAPLAFRRWTPETRMVPGHWNIPVPPHEAEALAPTLSLVPLVGWDDAGFRLGYGGGYFDRTLAALSPPPRTIGIGVQAARLPTIFPQPHDIPLDAILTEAGVQFLRSA